MISLTRRESLRAMGGLGLAGAALLSGCAPRIAANKATNYRGPHLAPVRVARERIIRRVVGLRPFRPSGFVVRAEMLGDKPLIHNYGHGGGGVTLSWGTAELAAELATQSGRRKFAVLGCGVIGLSTARRLQQRGYEVTIYSRELPPETTSNIAGAWWNPFDVFDRERVTPAFVDQFLRATGIAYRRFQSLVGPRYGVRWLSVYALREKPFAEDSLLGQRSPIREFLPGLRDLGECEKPFAFPVVRELQAMMIEPATYLDTLLGDYRLAGGRVEVREFKSREEIAALAEPAIVNCTGLGSRLLFDDPELIPIKGQLTILLPQPEVDYVALPPGLYMLPRSDGILLGGTFERGNYSLEPDLAAEERILAGHARAFGALVS